MTTAVSINGGTYNYPEENDTGWGTDATNAFVALSNSTLQLNGGSFTLTNDVDFGASYGLVSLHFTSKTASAASAGQVRLANADGIAWRNTGDSADLTLTTGSADGLLEYNSIDLVNLSATQTLTNKTLTSPTITGGTLSGVTISGATTLTSPTITSPTITLTGSPANHVVISDGSGQVTTEAVLAISRGGTNNGSLAVTNGSVLYADGSKVTSLAAGSTDELLTTQGAGAPQWKSKATLNISQINVAETRSASINMADNDFIRPEIKDYGITHTAPSSSSGAITFDCANGNSFAVSLTENITAITLSNPPASGTYGEIRIKFTQHASSSYTVAGWPAAVKWPDGVAFTKSSTTSSIDQVILATDDGGTTWLGNYVLDYS